ncbi:MAG: hypothetical protein HYY03_05745 [Chloroflexi bacterium]|nr:hypothetical protein [Chloroflexota bacterium]
MTTFAENATPQPKGHIAAIRWAAAIALTIAGISVAAVVQPAAADGPRLVVDASPSGNTPAELGPINSCVTVASDRSFRIDIVIQDVQDLLAWEVYLEYDPAILEVVGRDVDQFQGANPGSNVYDVSETVPDSDGLYRVAAADTADPPSPDSGSGVLARLTLRAIGPGISPASLARRDLNGDGKPDLGPFLRDANAEPIGDEDGDTFFDGATDNAQIAVDTDCPPGSQGPAPATTTDSGSTGFRGVYILAIALSAAAVAGLSTALLLYRRRAKAQPR